MSVAGVIDTLKSLVTGLGTSKDKTVTLGYALRLISDAELNAMHRSDWLARKVVDIIPMDMTREWRLWKAEQDQIEALEAYEQNPLINTRSKVNLAMRKARLLRGSGIYLGMRDQMPELPLDVEKVGKGDLLYLNVVNRSEISLGETIKDVTSEFYGQPSFYEVSSSIGSTVRIHPSRFIRFIGADVLDPQYETDGWGDSVLQIVYDAIQNSTSVQQHVAAMIPEAKTDVIYIPGLSRFLQNPTTTQQLTDRFAYANTIKSMFNMVLLEGNGNDQGEKWEQKNLTFEKLPEIAQLFLQIASGAADIPVTRLLGQSPAGLNATGESDIRNYYDNLSSRQENDLTPLLNRLDEVTIRSALGSRPDEIYYEWAPLWSISDKEKADIFNTKATAARSLVGSSAGEIIPIEAVSDALVNSFVEAGDLPGLEDAIEEYGNLAEQEDDEEDILAAAGAIAKRTQKAALFAPPAKAANDAQPKTLYVRRDVLNAAAITRWAASQGLTDILPDLHVTICYSKEPIDWIKAGNATEWGNDTDGKLTIPKGGPRVVEPLGNMSAVLMFASSALSWRHEDIMRAGASHDYDSYQPHISLTKAEIDPATFAAIEPYRGAIILGPEIFEEIKDD